MICSYPPLIPPLVSVSHSVGKLGAKRKLILTKGNPETISPLPQEISLLLVALVLQLRR